MTQSGLLLVDKSEGWTSHDIVARTRSLANTRRVGHAGTLDPMATGLLVLGINNATKLLTYLVGESKTYLATIRLGASTITDDRESDYTSVAPDGSVPQLSLNQIETALDALRGEIMQVPSSVSAIKVNGERAYAKVRGGDEVKLAPRPVTVSKFELLGEPRTAFDDQGHQFLDIDCEVDCSSGTYVRALARDLGAALGVGGHLTALRRIRVGNYSVASAKTMDELTAAKQSDNFVVTPIAAAARTQFLTRELSADEVTDLRHGKRIPVGLQPTPEKGQPVAAFGPSGELIAMLERSGKEFKSTTVFQPEQSNEVSS